MHFSLLTQLCGAPLLAVLVLTSLALTSFALYLVFSVRREPLLVAFLPVTALPLAAGLLSAFFSSLNGLEMQLNEETEIAFEPAFLLLMNAIPLLASLLACVPAATVLVLGRWMLAWNASGVRLVPERPAPPPSEEEQEAWIAREADSYLDKIVRPK